MSQQAVTSQARGVPQATDPNRRVHDENPETWEHFRCPCGRSVAIPADLPGADSRRCSRCRDRRRYEQGL